MLQISGETVWAFSALDDMKESCLQQVNRNSTFTQTPWGRHVAEQIRQSTCVNDCSNHGRYRNGTN